MRVKDLGFRVRVWIGVRVRVRVIIGKHANI